MSTIDIDPIPGIRIDVTVEVRGQRNAGTITLPGDSGWVARLPYTARQWDQIRKDGPWGNAQISTAMANCRPCETFDEALGLVVARIRELDEA